MKPNPVPPPHLVCRAVRWLLPADGQPVGVRMRRHLSRCPDCQQYAARRDTLERELRRLAPATPLPADPDRVARITAACAPHVRGRRRVRLRPGLVRGVGLVAVAVVLVLAFLVRPPASEPATPAPSDRPAAAVAAARAPEERRAVLELIPRGPVIWPAADAAALTRQNPLQQELAAVEADTRAALRFLARNFLPTGSLEPEEPQASS